MREYSLYFYCVGYGMCAKGRNQPVALSSAASTASCKHSVVQELTTACCERVVSQEKELSAHGRVYPSGIEGNKTLQHHLR